MIHGSDLTIKGFTTQELINTEQNTRARRGPHTTPPHPPETKWQVHIEVLLPCHTVEFFEIRQFAHSRN